MRQCHECGCDIAPGEVNRRQVVVGTTTVNTPQGFQTQTQTEVVDVCARCAEALDRRARQVNRSSALMIALFFAAFLGIAAAVYFFLVKPQLEEHERFRKQMEQESEQIRQKVLNP
jgi:hypothetical protein